MFNKIQIFSLLNKIFYVFLGVLIFKIGSNIPIYGINSNLLIDFDNKFNKVLESLNMFSGGALSQASIFSLAVMPFITASIIIQLLSLRIDYLSDLKNNGNEGEVTLKRITRSLTILIATFQGFYLCDFFVSSYNSKEVLYIGLTEFYILGTLSLVIGSLYITWIAEKITERGLGNGVSLIIYIGIVSSFPSLIKDIDLFLASKTYSYLGIFLILMTMISIFFVVVFIEKTQKRIKINVVNNRQPNSDDYLPFKINLSGVMPAIIAGVFVGLPLTVVSFFQTIFSIENEVLFKLKELFSMGNFYYYIFMGVLIFFFSFTYLKITNYKDGIMSTITNKNIIIDGIRPGKDTEIFIEKMIKNLSFVAAFYLFTLIIIPDIFMLKVGLSFYFGGTGLLIVILTTLDWIKEFKTHFNYIKYQKVKNKLANLME